MCINNRHTITVSCSPMIEARQVPTVATHFRLQWEPAQNCFVLLYPEGMVKLNTSAGEILACCDGQRSIAAITEVLQTKFPEGGDLSEDIIEFIGVARDQHWIELA